MKRKRLVFIAVLLVFLAACLWRALWFPYDPLVLYRAVPPTATLISEHRQLAERWSTWAGHPLVRGIALGLGAKEKDVEQAAEDALTRALLHLFGKRNTVLAYTPDLAGRPAWILASWSGAQAQLVKWGFYNKLLGDFDRRTFRDGRKGWVLRDAKDLPPGMNLTLTVTEGVLLGAFAADPESIGLLVRRIEGKASLTGVLARHQDQMQKTFLDRFCFGDTWDAPGPGHVPAVWCGRFDLGAPPVAEGQVHGPVPEFLHGLETGDAHPAIAELAPLLGDSPAALVVGPAALVPALAGRGKIGKGVRVFWDRLQGRLKPDAAAFVSLCAPEYSGRILGFAAATLVIGVQVQDETAVEIAIGEGLDEFNARSGTTLIRRESGTVTLVESVRSGPLSRLAQSERPSYAVRDGWLLIASNRDALARILQETGGKAGDWATSMAMQPGGVAAWVDLAAADAAVARIAAIVDLASLATGRNPDIVALRQNLAQAQQWLSLLSPMHNVNAWAGLGGEDSELRLRFGPAPARRDG